MCLARIQWALRHGVYGNRVEVMLRVNNLSETDRAAFYADDENRECLSDLPADAIEEALTNV